MYKKAQHITEFAWMISIISIAVFGITVYARRGMQGRYKQASDFVFDSIVYSQEYHGVETPEDYVREYEVDWAHSREEYNIDQKASEQISYNQDEGWTREQSSEIERQGAKLMNKSLSFD